MQIGSLGPTLSEGICEAGRVFEASEDCKTSVGYIIYVEDDVKQYC